MEFDIDFRPFTLEDARFVNKLRREESIERFIGGSKRPVSLERDIKWVQDIIMNDNQSIIYFAITPKGSEEIIGYTSISEIDFRNGTCFWSGIKIDNSRTGRGLGTQVALKILKFVFEELRMQRCKGECLEQHEAVLKMLHKVGYKSEGLMRSSVYKNGIYNNQWLLSVIKDDYADIKNKFNI